MDVLADLAVADKSHAFGGHQIDAALHGALVELHVGDAVHQEAADAVGTLKDGDPVTGLVELGGTGQACGTGTDDGHCLARPLGRRFGDDPAFFKALINNGAFDALDGDRRLIDAEDAGSLAGRGTNTAGEFGKVVGLVQAVKRFLPEPAVDKVVPLRDQVVDRTACRHAFDQRARMAEGHTAIHAAGALLLHLLVAAMFMEFQPVANAHLGRSSQRQLARIIQESRRLTHSCALAEASGYCFAIQNLSSSPSRRIS